MWLTLVGRALLWTSAAILVAQAAVGIYRVLDP
jgi:hypothetical protein